MSQVTATVRGRSWSGPSTGRGWSGHPPARRWPTGAVFYCAESVLLPGYRGQGIGHRFFDLREAHARTMGFTHCAFCSVIRPADHPARPADYRPLDGFWRARGYAPMPGVIAEFSWKDLGEDHETRKPLQFWMRAL